MKTRIGGLLLALTVGVALGWVWRSTRIPTTLRPEIVASFRVNDQQDAQFMLRQIMTIRLTDLAGESVDYRVVGNNSGAHGYVLEAYKPLIIPDHHGSAQLHLLEIANDKARIGYQWRFEHYSFGEDKETIRSGVVELEIEPREFAP